mmetsp:Transcript_33883/g.74333  ORF Transcript_33883/g.74333 Transcript_33883/m.74333 type:complete len:259 (+) Transcript_33883:106-882(+)
MFGSSAPLASAVATCATALLLSAAAALPNSKDTNGLAMPKARTAVVEFLGTSLPVKDMADKPSKPFTQDEPEEVPLFLPPFKEADIIAAAPGELDGALDEGNGASGMPAPIQNFDGINPSINPQIRDFTPPDTVGDVGPDHYVQMVNTAFAIYDKSGNEIQPPREIDLLFEDGDPDCGNGGGDPIVLYDQFEDRWFLTQFTRACRDDASTPCYNCIAVSTSGDPTSTYNLYKVRAQEDPDGIDGSVFPDYLPQVFSLE